MSDAQSGPSEPPPAAPATAAKTPADEDPEAAGGLALTEAAAEKPGEPAHKPRRWPWVLIALSLGVLVWTALGGKASAEFGGHDIRAFARSTVRLPGAADSAAIVLKDGSEKPLRLTVDGAAAWLPSDTVTAAFVRVRLKDRADTPVDLRVSIIDPIYGRIAGAAGITALLAALLLMRSTPGTTGPLAERGGGLSLSRVQLLIWFIPAFAMFVALSVPLLDLAPIDPSFAVLFGLSGLTAVLSPAASPHKPDSAPPPNLRDLVEDWQCDLDFSRIQCLALTVVGALVLLASFVPTMRVPSVPEGFLGLLGVSQAAYMGTKVVKQAKDT